MELRQSVSLSSTWEARGDMRAALHIISNSGILLDEPLVSEQAATPLLLQAPSPDQPCLLHVDLHRLRGYSLTQLELTSTSRTTELYQRGDEYVGTVRGSVAGSCEHGSVQKLYSCQHMLPSDDVSQELTIKLLSLRGRAEVLIHKLQLVVTEDLGGTTTAPGRPASGQLDMQQLLEDIPVHNMPPFIQTLVSSLQHLPGKGGDSGSPEGLPAQLSQLVESFKKLRPPPPACEAEDESGLKLEGKDSDEEVEGGGAKVEDSSEGKERDSIVKLEARLKLYIDEKFEQLERKLEKQIEELLSKLQSERSCLRRLAEDEQLD